MEATLELTPGATQNLTSTEEISEMASIIRIKRSSGTNKPASLQWGELGYVTGIGSYGGLNQYKDRVFLGDDGTNANPVGGYYYTSMMEHETGVIPAASHNSRNQDRGVVAIMAPLPIQV